MNVEDTNNNNAKICSKCGEEKPANRIVRNRKICKDCCNAKTKESLKLKIENIDKTVNRTCKKCSTIKLVELFSRSGVSHICIDCSNIKRREKYENNEELRTRAIKESIEFKKKKKAERDEIKKKELDELEDKIGKDNTICKYCKKVKAKSHFRHNRLKCKDCEREDPKYKLHKLVRSRIHDFLKKNNEIKSKHTCEYLGCTREEYIKWLLYNSKNYTIENHGKEWHIDHVIPLSRFNLDKKEDVDLAFNWRNTMPLSVKENLSKNNKILLPQIKQHIKLLKKYHKENNITLPQKFIKLYAKHLEAGIPLEP